MGNGESNGKNNHNSINRIYNEKESNEKNRIDEICPFPNKYVVYDDTDKIRMSICKIKSNNESKEGFGTGFFINYKSYKYLLTNYHVISEKSKKVDIEIWDKSWINLNLNNRYIIYLPKPKDITIISLKIGEIDKIKYLTFDLNFSQGYTDYKYEEALAIGYPKGEKLASGNGTIGEIINDYEFFHNIPTDHGSSGSPIILCNNLKVIGIHKESDNKKKLNVGTFIGEAIKEIDKNKLNTLFIKDSKLNCYLEKKLTKIKIARNIDNNSVIELDNNLAKIKKMNNVFKKDNNLQFKINVRKKRTSSVDLDTRYNEKKKKNEIDCVYIVKKNKEINLLYDFQENVNNYSKEECKLAHNEAKKELNNNNIDIFINEIKVEFNRKYKSSETGLLYVKFKFKKLLVSTSFMFYKCSSLKSIDLSSFNESKITNMMCMFDGCSFLESINFSLLNINEVTSLLRMFADCSSLKSIDFKSFNTSNVTNMSALFKNCSSLESINLSKFKTKNVTDMDSMFYNCSSLKYIDLLSFNTSNVVNMKGMFEDCLSLKSIDLSSFNKNNANDMSFMFYNCKSIESINLYSFCTNKVNNMSSMFYDCEKLRSLDLSSFNTNNVTDMSFMFRGCSWLNSLYLTSSFKTNNVTNMKCMFAFCYSLKSLNLISFDTSNVLDMYGMFFCCDWLRYLDLSSFDVTNVVCMRWMFNLCSSLERKNIKVGEKGSKILDEYETYFVSNVIKAIFK